MRATVRAAVVITCAVAFAGCPAPCGDTVYFLVSEVSPLHGDSYVLPLTDPDDIAQARAIAADPEGAAARIVVAKISAGGACDYTNRDFLNGGTRRSWCVTEFDGFAEMTIEILDGWPEYVDENLDEWMETTNGAIGFWSYTVTRELTPWETLWVRRAPV